MNSPTPLGRRAPPIESTQLASPARKNQTACPLANLGKQFYFVVTLEATLIARSYSVKETADEMTESSLQECRMRFKDVK